MQSVEAPEETKSAFYFDLRTALEAADYKEMENVAIRHFYRCGWRWPEYEKWKVMFDQGGECPFSWHSLGVTGELKTMPDNVSESLCYFTVSELKGFIKNLNIQAKPAPKNRSQVEDAFKKHVPFDAISSMVQERYGDYLSGYNKDRDEGLCRLLVNTIYRTFNNLKRYQQIQDLNYDPGTPVAARRVVISRCDDDDKVGKLFSDKYNDGKLDGLPPFFPGDNSSLFSMRSR